MLVFTGFAIGFDLLEHWCAGHGVSDWLVFGMGLIAKISYIFDGMLFVATSGMVGAHFIREMFNKFFRQ